MKQVLKKVLGITLALSMIFSFSNVALAEEFEHPDDMTMQYLEEEWKGHLAENHPEIEFGTVDFIDYLVEVLLEETDPILLSKPHYMELRYYGGEYLYELGKAQVETAEPFEVFLTSDAFRAKTVGEIKEEVRLKEIKEEKLYEEVIDRRMVKAIATLDTDVVVTYILRHGSSSDSGNKTYSRAYRNHVSQMINENVKPIKMLVGVSSVTTDIVEKAYWHWNDSMQ